VTCPATCSSTAGTLFYFSSLQQADATWSGRWRICSDAGKLFAGKPADAIGVEFVTRTIHNDRALEGDAFYLVAGTAGATRGAGTAYRTTYRIIFSSGTINVMMDAGNGYFPRYSPCPEQVQLTGNSGDSTLIAAMD
jgi:hypothetical protein